MPNEGQKNVGKKKVLPGLEPGLQGSEPWVLTNYTIEPSSTERQWCIGNIEASQALAPGSTPGWRILFFVFVCITTHQKKEEQKAYWRD